MKRIIKIISVTVLFAVMIVCLILFRQNGNPFTDVEWIRNVPKENGAFVTYTPVLKSDHTIRLGPTMGVDYGELLFKDLNNDGIKEVIIETKPPKKAVLEYTPQRHILRYRRDVMGLPHFAVNKSETLSK